MPRVLLILVIVAITVYALVEAAQTRPTRVRLLPRWLWVVAIIALPLLGPAGWFALGRPGKPTGRRPIAPDDDQDFLRGL